MILVPCYAKDLKLGMFIQCNRAQEFCGRMLHTPNVFRTIENINDFSMPYDKVSISLHDTPSAGCVPVEFFQEDIVVVMFKTRKAYDKFRYEQEAKRSADDVFFDDPDGDDTPEDEDEDELEDDDDAERHGSYTKHGKGN